MRKPTLSQAVTGCLCSELRQGFRTPAVMTRAVIDRLADDFDRRKLRAAIKSLLPSLREKHRESMRSWPKVTDCDRLDAAFEDLNARGIMARHDWWCCGTCGTDAMRGEFDRLTGRINRKAIIGYVFYHQQDTEIAADGHGLFLNYGSCDLKASGAKYNAKCLAIGKAARQVLKAHGLTVEWNGKLERRLAVKLNWQRRSRPPRFCGDAGTRPC